MAVQSDIVVTLDVAGSTPTGLEIPVAPRGMINRLVVVETTSVGGVTAVDVYNKVVALAGDESLRAPYRILPRVSTTVSNSELGGENAVGLFDKAYAYKAGESANTAKKVAKSIFIVLTPPGAGTRTFSISLTITDAFV